MLFTLTLFRWISMYDCQWIVKGVWSVIRFPKCTSFIKWRGSFGKYIHDMTKNKLCSPLMSDLLNLFKRLRVCWLRSLMEQVVPRQRNKNFLPGSVQSIVVVVVICRSTRSLLCTFRFTESDTIVFLTFFVWISVCI